jgi:hypothetical protein
LQNDLTNLSSVLKIRFKDQNGNWLPTKNIQQLIEWMLYCKPVSTAAAAQDYIDSWTCTPLSNCRSLTSEWELYRNYYLKIKSKYVQLAKLGFDSSCKNCFIGQDPISAGICEEPGPVSDYQVLQRGFYYDLIYKPNNIQTSFKGNYKVIIEVSRGGEVEKTLTVFTSKGSISLNNIYECTCCHPPAGIPCSAPELNIVSVTCANGLIQQSCDNSGGSGNFTCPAPSDFSITQGTDGFGHNTIIVDYLGTQAPFPPGVTVQLSFLGDFTYGPESISFNVDNNTGDWIYVFPQSLVSVEYNTATVDCSGVQPPPSCPTPMFYNGSYNGSGYHVYPAQTIDATLTPVGSVISANCNALDVPNRITIRDGGGNFLVSTGWFGHSDFPGPWGSSINTLPTQVITFTRNAYDTYTIEAETVTQGTSDAWNVNLSCDMASPPPPSTSVPSTMRR